MSREPVKPYLIAKDEEGEVRLTIRETRFNSQGYPLITSTTLEEKFKTATAARAHYPVLLIVSESPTPSTTSAPAAIRT